MQGTSPANIEEYCCKMMRYQATYKCERHDSPFKCPDNVIYHYRRDNSYGIIVHDGGESVIEIKYCPWCGASLNREKQA